MSMAGDVACSGISLASILICGGRLAKACSEASFKLLFWLVWSWEGRWTYFTRCSTGSSSGPRNTSRIMSRMPDMTIKARRYVEG